MQYSKSLEMHIPFYSINFDEKHLTKKLIKNYIYSFIIIQKLNKNKIYSFHNY